VDEGGEVPPRRGRKKGGAGAKVVEERQEESDAQLSEVAVAPKGGDNGDKVAGGAQGPVPPGRVTKAAEALVKHMKASQDKEETNLLQETNFVSLVVTLTKIPDKSRVNPYKIPLQHSLFVPGECEICFLVKDPQRKVKDLLSERGHCGVTKVLGVSKLRARYKTFEAKRGMCRDFDLFFADRSILPMLPKLLGKPFFHSKKYSLLFQRCLAFRPLLTYGFSPFFCKTTCVHRYEKGHCTRADARPQQHAPISRARHVQQH